MSCDCDVTCLFIVTKKKKKFKRKRNIKSRKIDKRKRKILVSKAFHNTLYISRLYDLEIVSYTIETTPSLGLFWSTY